MKMKEIDYDHQKPFVIQNFCHTVFRGGQISASVCIIYPNAGVALIDKTGVQEKLLMFIPCQRVTVALADGMHYALRLFEKAIFKEQTERNEMLYLAIKPDLRDIFYREFKIGDKVLRGDNGNSETCSDIGILTYTYLNRKDWTLEYLNEICAGLKWEIQEIYHHCVARIVREKEQTYCLLKDLNGVDEVLKSLEECSKKGES